MLKILSLVDLTPKVGLLLSNKSQQSLLVRGLGPVRLSSPGSGSFMR